MSSSYLIDAGTYPRLTMLGQSFGSMILVYQALWKKSCGIFVDTTGHAFAFPIAKLLFSCKVVAYVHYPTISTDMLRLVHERRSTLNNSNEIASSSLVSRLKLGYYVLFAALYALNGLCVDVVMVNSSWTFGHIKFLWGHFVKQISIIFPPCPTQHLEKFPLKGRQKIILSIGQFRPEKDHQLQLRVFHDFVSRNPHLSQGVQLVLIGGVRNPEDQDRVEMLIKLCEELEVHVSAFRGDG